LAEAVAFEQQEARQSPGLFHGQRKLMFKVTSRALGKSGFFYQRQPKKYQSYLK